jgi:hypothetical protein
MARRGSSFLLCLFSVGFFSACGDFAAQVRRHTYPPDFHYIPREQLRSTMWQLAYNVRELDRIVREPEQERVRHGEEIVNLLVGMERAVGELGRQGWPSNHPLIDANLVDFRRDITLAREAAQRRPPSYIQAGLVTGACVYCHNRGG